MKIMVNGEGAQVSATRLPEILDELGYGEAKIATALNEDFVAADTREEVTLEPGDRLEIVAPRQGG